MPVTYANLLRLCEIVLGVDVQSHFAKRSDRNDFLGNELRWIQYIKSKGQLLVLIEYLNSELSSVSIVSYDEGTFINVPPIPDILQH